MKIAILLTLILVVIQVAAANTPQEVSEDGHECARLTPSYGDGQVSYGGREVLFGSAPDWQNTLRMQVGGLQVADLDGDGWPELALGHDPTRLYNNDGVTLSLAWESGAGYHGHSDIRFCDIEGRRLVSLRDGSADAGRHAFSWTGRDGEGRLLASGVYLCRLVADGKVLTRRLTLLK